ncbi:MAG TPA: metalloregulator ArsR/SmtB family transcription factor [Bacillota bacterium]|jgi:ArsR family transcriptional regulator
MTPDRLAEVMRAMSDPLRLRILGLVKPGELCVGELVAALHVSQPTVSQHLARLKAARLLKSHRRGQRAFYELDPEPEVTRLVEAALGVVGPLGREWSRLKVFAADSAARRRQPPHDED